MKDIFSKEKGLLPFVKGAFDIFLGAHLSIMILLPTCPQRAWVNSFIDPDGWLVFLEKLELKARQEFWLGCYSKYLPAFQYSGSLLL